MNNQADDKKLNKPGEERPDDQDKNNDASVNEMREYENLIDPGNEHRHDENKEKAKPDADSPQD